MSPVGAASNMKKENKADTHSLGPTSRSLPIALLRGRETVMLPIREMLQKSGMTEQQWRVLRVVDEINEIEPSNIAEQACITLPSLTRILRGMEEQKLITRKIDPTDRRRTLVSLTRRGQKIIQENVDQNGAIFSALESRLGKRKLSQLLDLLEDLQQIKL